MQEETVDGKVTTAGHYKVLMHSSLESEITISRQFAPANSPHGQFAQQTIRPRCEIEWNSTLIHWSFMIDDHCAKITAPQQTAISHSWRMRLFATKILEVQKCPTLLKKNCNFFLKDSRMISDLGFSFNFCLLSSREIWWPLPSCQKDKLT